MLHHTLCSSCSAEPCTPKTLLSAPWNACTTAGWCTTTRQNPSCPPIAPFSSTRLVKTGSQRLGEVSFNCSLQCSKCLLASRMRNNVTLQQTLCHSVKILNNLSSVVGDKRTRCLRWRQTKNTFYLRHAAAARGGRAVSSTVSVLGTVLGPIHTTLLGLFHPRTPQPLWNSGGIDRRKLKPCLEFTTISRDRGAGSHQQEYNFLPRPRLFSSWSSFLLADVHCLTLHLSLD